jgi:ribosome-associated protein
MTDAADAPANILVVTPDLVVPRAELEYRASRSGGPGGQHVNTSSTRIELWWDVAASPSPSEAQRARLLERLATRLDAAGRLRLVSSGSRSQLQNREEVTARFVDIVARALHVPKARKKTKPTRASKQKRLETKKRRSEVKRMRGRIDRD